MAVQGVGIRGIFKTHILLPVVGSQLNLAGRAAGISRVYIIPMKVILTKHRNLLGFGGKTNGQYHADSQEGELLFHNLKNEDFIFG